MTSRDELIERLAKALYQAFLDAKLQVTATNWENATYAHEIYRAMAEAALVAFKPGDTWDNLYVEEVCADILSNHPTDPLPGEG